MMKGITPIAELKIPKKINLDFMLERLSQRKIAVNCGRCGGTGKFRTVGFPGVGSRYGSHCFQCGDAWRLPLKWSSMKPEEIAVIFCDGLNHEYNLRVIADFVKVGILDQEKADAVIKLLRDSQT